MVENEISILRRVKHKNIVELIEEYETPKEIFLVMELVKVSITYRNCGGQQEPAIQISKLLLRLHRMYVASIHLDFH